MLVNGDGNNELNNNTSNKHSTGNKEIEVCENNELPQVSVQTSDSIINEEVHPYQTDDSVYLKTNDQLLDEVKNIAKSRSTKKVKCKICTYQTFIIQNCSIPVTNVFNSDFLIHTNCLVELNLSDNNLEQFPEIITEFVNLLKLNLSHNKLKQIPNTCVLLKQLRYLNLSHNQISYESPKCLELGLYFITHLNLSYNLICSFSSCPKCVILLEDLNLSHNYLDSAPKWLFTEKCRSLVKLNLSYSFVINQDFQNKVKEGQYLRTNIMKTCKSLSLKYCNISLPSLDVVQYFQNINCLNIGNDFEVRVNGPWKHNVLWDIPLNIFYNVEKITELHIYNLGIATLPNELYLLKNLKVLNASHNCLTWLPETFFKFEHIEVINLASNKLISLPKNFNQMVSIKELYLCNNQLGDLSNNLNTLYNLEVLDLYNNCLEEMPVSDNHLRLLNKLDLAYNPLVLEISLDRNFEDGKNVLDFYKELEKNLRSSLKETVSRKNESKPLLAPQSAYFEDNTASSISTSSDFYSSSESGKSENEVNDYEDYRANEQVIIEEEDWCGGESDDNYDPCAFTSHEPLPYPDFQDLLENTYTRNRDHFFLPSQQHASSVIRRKTNFIICPDQFTGAESSD